VQAVGRLQCTAAMRGFPNTTPLIFAPSPPQQDVSGLMEDLQKQFLIPMQRQSFVCSANCCDPKQQLPAIQQWCVPLGSCLELQRDQVAYIQTYMRSRADPLRKSPPTPPHPNPTTQHRPLPAADHGRPTSALRGAAELPGAHAALPRALPGPRAGGAAVG